MSNNLARFVFSYENLETINLNKEQVLGFMERLKESNLLSKIKYKESGVAPGEALAVTQKRIVKLFENEELPAMGTLTPSQVANFAFFFPSTAWLEEEEVMKSTLLMTGLEINAMFLEEQNVLRCLEAIGRANSYRITADIVLILSLASSYFAIYENSIHEIQSLRHLMSRITQNTNKHLVETALNRRIKNLSSKPTDSIDKTLPSALFVTGQLRGYKDGIGSVWPQIPNKEQIDVYVSTWRNPGGSTIDRHRLSRRFTPEAVEYILSQNVDIEDLKTYVNKIMMRADLEELTTSLNSMFPGARSVRIKIHDEQEYPFNQMSNPEKMYFQNSYWIYTIGKDRLLTKYKSISKVRPDFRFKLERSKFDFTTKDADLYADRGGWLFDVWGFGMADQLISGKTDVAVQVLGVTGFADLSAKLLIKIFGRQEVVMGHMNCGLEAWLAGVTVKSIESPIYSFSEVEPLGIEVVRQYESWKK